MSPKDKDWIKIATFLFLIAAFFGVKEWKDVPHGFWKPQNSIPEHPEYQGQTALDPTPNPPSTQLNLTESIESLSAPRSKEPIVFPRLENSKQEGSSHRYDLPGGGYFEGVFQNGKAYGHGSYTMPNGACYDGELREGLAEGEGTTVNKDGSHFKGTFHAGLPIGKGFLKFADGTRFEGIMLHIVSPKDAGTKSEGVYTFPSGAIFEGFLFRNDDNSHVSGRGILRNLPNQLPTTQMEIDGQGLLLKEQAHITADLLVHSKQGTMKTSIDEAMSKSENSSATTGYVLFKSPDGSSWKVETRNGTQDKFGTFTYPNGHTERRKITQQPF